MLKYILSTKSYRRTRRKKKPSGPGGQNDSLTLDQAVAAVAAHLGIVNQQEINNMSIPFFNDVLAALGKRLNFESVSNLYGNSFAKDATKYINEANPLYKAPKIGKAFAGILNQATIVKFEENNVKDTFGDVSWAEGLFGATSAQALGNIIAADKDINKK